MKADASHRYSILPSIIPIVSFLLSFPSTAQVTDVRDPNHFVTHRILKALVQRKDTTNSSSLSSSMPKLDPKKQTRFEQMSDHLDVLDQWFISQSPDTVVETWKDFVRTRNTVFIDAQKDRLEREIRSLKAKELKMSDAWYERPSSRTILEAKSNLLRELKKLDSSKYDQVIFADMRDLVQGTGLGPKAGQTIAKISPHRGSILGGDRSSNPGNNSAERFEELMKIRHVYAQIDKISVKRNVVNQRNIAIDGIDKRNNSTLQFHGAPKSQVVNGNKTAACVPFAIIANMESKLAKETGKTADLSPWELYFQTQIIDEKIRKKLPLDSASPCLVNSSDVKKYFDNTSPLGGVQSTLRTIQVANANGVCEYAKFPAFPSSSDLAKSQLGSGKSFPGTLVEVWKRKDASGKETPLSLSHIQTAIDSGRSLLAEVKTDSRFESEDWLDLGGVETRYWHALNVVGYDLEAIHPSTLSREPAVIVIDSLGKHPIPYKISFSQFREFAIALYDLEGVTEGKTEEYDLKQSIQTTEEVNKMLSPR